jgi:hypothetical protein
MRSGCHFTVKCAPQPARDQNGRDDGTVTILECADTKHRLLDYNTSQSCFLVSEAENNDCAGYDLLLLGHDRWLARGGIILVELLIAIFYGKRCFWFVAAAGCAP